MDDNAGAYYVLDGVAIDAVNFEYAGTVKSRVVYEVIRVINGVPLFFEDHYTRLVASVCSIGGTLGSDANELKSLLNTVLKTNGNFNCNVKIMVHGEDGRQKMLLYISKSSYPSKEEIEKGVAVGLFKLERQDPNVKLFNKSYKDAVNSRMQEYGLYEVLLVNSSGGITEGSKSNVFFVRGDRIFTAPGEFVLKGVTRKYVLEACRNAGFDVVEQLTYTMGLDDIEGLFLSGTSIKVLPVSSIDGFIYDSSAHPVITAVRNEYDRLVKKYIETNVKIW